ncbi:MAG TPA: hypothetical protein PK069_09045 [Methanolinea sp.]|nr:hypothetical protein [Methanolinea sp.]
MKIHKSEGSDTPGGPSGIAHGSLPLASRARPAGELAGVLDRFAPATPSLRSVAASALLVMVDLVSMTTAGLDSPGRLLRFRSVTPSGRSTGRSARSRYTGSGPKGTPHDHCLSSGRGGGRSIRARSEGGSSAPLEVTRGRGSGVLESH